MENRNITVGAVQASFSKDRQKNLRLMVDDIKKSVSSGAQVVLLPELFESHYFCKEEKEDFFNLAHEVKDHPTLRSLSEVAKDQKVVLPVSFFEKSGPHYYNSVAVIDADGRNLGVYRKSHIPDGPGYEEKFYFKPGNTGFQVWKTAYCTIGVGICWDQWFPECARSMVLSGAEVLFYPTAIGSEPDEPELDTRKPWQRAMIGHAVSNVVPVVAANRIGREGSQTFYGHSFICDPQGEKLQELSEKEAGTIEAEFDLDRIQMQRASFGFFRDRRPDLYQRLTEL